MEIYTNSRAAGRTVAITFPHEEATNLSVDVFVYQNGEQVAEIAQVVQVPNKLTCVLPLSMVQFDSTLEVVWKISFDELGEPVNVTKKTLVEVVTPILSAEEILEVWDTATPAEVVKIEKAVRHIIQAYTGQTFGMYIGKEKVRGTNNKSIFTQKRLIELYDVDGQNASGYFRVHPEGYIVEHYAYGIPPVKADYFGLHMHTGGVIHNPNNVTYHKWASDRTYELNGRWGWEAVPEPVKEAAKLLVNDYACADSQYRDRYLVSMTAADWRIQFNSGAYLRTGNVRADQLLSEYVITRGWGVI